MAQTDAQLTQYYEMPSLYNPSAIGNTDYINIRGGVRVQWLGIDNAPRDFLVTADMPLKLFGKRIGVGVVMGQESIGLFSNMNIDAQVAYKFRKFGGEFSIGVGLGIYDQTFKGSETLLPDDDNYHQGTDNGVPVQDLHGTAFDIQAGIWYTHKYFWAGLGATHITSPTVTLNSDTGDGGASGDYIFEFNAGRTLYFTAGGNIPIKNTLFEIMPSALVKSDFTFFTAELTARARWRKMFSFGVAYRWDDAVSAILAVEIKDFYVGYAYDYPVSAIAKASSGSHEIVAGYRLKLDLSDKNKNKHKAIRIM